MKLLTMLLASFMLCSITFSHPVIWKNGTVITSKFTDSISEYKSHYSITNKWAMGLHGLRLDQKNFAMLQNNFLVFRGNKAGSQANMYFFSGLGSQINESQSIVHAGFQIDWETRVIYTQFNYNGYYNDDTTHKINARIGLSPYLAEYSDLHSWLILQLDSTVKSSSTETKVMPVMRFFKDNYLVEIGSNFNTTYLLTLMMHI